MVPPAPRINRSAMGSTVFVATGLAMEPVPDKVSKLTDAEVKNQLAGPRCRRKHSLTVR